MAVRPLLSVATLLIAAIPTLSWAGAAEAPIPDEMPRDPPAAKAAADDPLARSPASRAVTGPYVSIQVNVDLLGRNIVGDAANEPSIAVNPINPQNMVIGWRQFNSVSSDWRQAGYASTFNKGAKWRSGSITSEFGSDPVIDVDSSGNFYYDSLAHSGSVLYERVFKSTDGGVSWGPEVFAYGGDKNWLAVDRTGGPGEGVVYEVWQGSGSISGPNTFTRSIDGGSFFESPLPIPHTPFFGTLTVGPDGTVYAIGGDGIGGTHDFTQFVLVRTTSDPGPATSLTFAGATVFMGGAMVLSREGSPNPGGLLGQANVATDHSNGPTRGHVYVLASVDRNGSLDVMLARSVDGGRTFSEPVRVNDDPPPPDVSWEVPPPDNPPPAWHWFAAHAVAPNGRIDAIWFDTRESGASRLSRLYYSYSWDAGVTWSRNVAVSPQFDSWVGWPQQNKIGDYMTLVSDATGADVAYPATFNHEQDIYYVRLFPDCNGNGLSDITDLATHTSFDCNLNHVPDECELAPACIGAGAVAESGAPGMPLQVEKSAGDAIVLTWGASCATEDADYAVYEGTLLSFGDRTPRICSTGGSRTYGLTPAPLSSYYLVVPVHADREGSYGKDGAGAERSPAPVTCLQQTIRACGG